jgi:hypothetical protein
MLIGMDAVPVYHENGYDALGPADGALRQMPAHGAAYNESSGDPACRRKADSRSGFAGEHIRS